MPYSQYDVYTLTEAGHAVAGGLYPGLLVGAGHALFAFEIALLDGIEPFFRCVCALEPRATYHDVRPLPPDCHTLPSPGERAAATRHTADGLPRAHGV